MQNLTFKADLTASFALRMLTERKGSLDEKYSRAGAPLSGSEVGGRLYVFVTFTVQEHDVLLHVHL